MHIETAANVMTPKRLFLARTSTKRGYVLVASAEGASGNFLTLLVPEKYRKAGVFAKIRPKIDNLAPPP